MTTIRHCPSGSPSSPLTPRQQQRRQQRRPRRLSDRQLMILVLMVATVGVVQTLVLLSQLPKTRTNVSSSDATSPLTPSPMVNHSTHPTSIHAIPRILIFTHYRDLWNDPQDSLTDSEERVMAANIRNVVALHQLDNRRATTITNHNNVTVRFLTDDHCIQSLQRTFPSLIPFFQTERQGMFKADICRGSALYETGGIYLDVDVGVRYDLWKDLQPTTAFVTAQVHGDSKYPGHFFQAIMGAAPDSPIIYKYLQLFHDHYQGIERVDKGPLGVILLRRAWDRIYNHHTHTPPTELYQEVLYDKKLFPQLHPAPTWGIRRACHFVVVAKANHKSNAEFTSPTTTRTNKKHTKKDSPQDLCIPLYSRIAGSRMCPIATHTSSAHHNQSGHGMERDKTP